MSDFQITQEEAEKFLKEEKYRIDNTKHTFPPSGKTLNIPLKTKASEADFILDIYRGKIALKKITFQTRVRKEIILAS